MARPQGTSPRTQRLIALLAIGAVAIATAFAFGRVFDGHGSTWRLMGVALLSGGVAALLERRNLLLATLVSAAVLAVVIGILVFPGTTWHGLPTLDTWRHAVAASHLVGEQARLQVAPAPALKPLMLASILALWAAIFSCHALAFRAGSPLMSLLPPIALLAFADTVLEEFIKPLYGVAFLAAALAIVFADGLRRVQGWGPVWSGPGSRARLSATASHGARRVAAAAVTTAALVPLLVPGFGSKAIFDISSTSEQDRVQIDPLVSIKAALTRRDPVEVFQVESDQASYWRMLSLPNFDGTTWRPDIIDPGVVITPDTTLGVAIPGTETIAQTFRVSSDLGFPWLPVAYPPQRIEVADSEVRFNDGTGTATLEDHLDAGAEYHVTSSIVQPTPEQLAVIAFPPSTQVSGLTSLGTVSADVQAAIRSIAEAWTADATNDYEAILAIQDHLNDTSVFTYDTNVRPRDDAYTLLRFLTTDKHGFCQQFASAMAVMLRTLGIPSRVAEGFTQGQPDPDTPGVWHVTTSELHSWVEVLFPTYGWLAFEPTPGRTNPVALAYQHPTAACPSGDPGCAAGGPGGVPGGPGTTGDPGDLPGQLGNVLRREVQAGLPIAPVPTAPIGESGGRLPLRITLLLMLGLALLVALLLPPVRAVARRAGIRRAGHEPRAMILATYDLFTERAADLGMPRTPGETLVEYGGRLASSGTVTDGHLDRLTSITGRAAYAPGAPSESEVREASEAASSVLHDLRERTPFARRLAGQYRLRR
jgi:transglutaminase-like putative cysteine protease